MRGWESSSVKSSMCEALGSVSSTEKKRLKVRFYILFFDYLKKYMCKTNYKTLY
jgi:hypothetical protein